MNFRSEFRFLSNFYDCIITYDGLTYKSAEAAYQATKIHSKESRELFCDLSAKDAKYLGNNIHPIRSDWEGIKLKIMEDIVRIKFNIPSLKEKLLATGDIHLEEGNWWGDQYWGVCNSVGENHLGKILMKIRQELRSNG